VQAARATKTKIEKAALVGGLTPYPIVYGKSANVAAAAQPIDAVSYSYCKTRKAGAN
jgi:hypothetical protein